MDMNELAERLAMLEDADAERLAMEEQRGFIDKYGTKFSGDEGIGMAILAEMNRRGVPSAAVGADRVVQEILDGIRQEATQILDKIKADTETVNALIDEVKDIQESVNAATSGDTTTDGTLDIPPIDMGLPPEGLPPEGLPPEGLPPEGLPPEGDMMAPLPDEGVPPPEVPGPGAPIAGEMPTPIPPQPPIASDRRTKFTIKPRKPIGTKPASHILSAITGGRG